MGDRGGLAGAGRGAGLSPGGRRAALAAAALLAASVLLSGVPITADGPAAVDVFLRPRGYFLGPGTTVTIPVFDSTPGAGASVVARQRLVDLSLAGPGGRSPIDRATWTAKAPRSTFRVTVGGPGTHVVGVALGPRADDHERQASEAKTLLAVTDATGHLLPPATLRARSAATEPLGHHLEIVPLVDPYALAVGDALAVQVRRGGTPLAGARLRAGGTVGTSPTPIPTQAVTTDTAGRAEVRLTHDGHWLVACVQPRAAATQEHPGLVSRGATLTFGLLPAGAR